MDFARIKSLLRRIRRITSPRRAEPIPARAIGGISDERLQIIPANLVSLHEIAFFFHDQAVQCLKELDRPELRSFKFEISADRMPETATLKAMNGIDLARLVGFDEDAKRLLLNECILALTADALHFICEGLFAYEKGKLVVSLTLMRKPFKENLLYLEWILADPEGFYSAFADIERRPLLVESLSPERKREFISLAMTKTGLATLRDANLLYDLRYNKQANGLEPLWQKAAHLVTIQNPRIRTEEENFNFIFATEENKNGIYEHIALPYMLLCIHFHDMTITAARQLAPLHEGTVRYHEMCKFAGYTYVTGDWASFGSVYHEHLRAMNALAKCGCGAKLKIEAQDIAKALFTRKLPCSACGEWTNFDLYYLMGFDKEDA